MALRYEILVANQIANATGQKSISELVSEKLADGNYKLYGNPGAILDRAGNVFFYQAILKEEE